MTIKQKDIIQRIKNIEDNFKKAANKVELKKELNCLVNQFGRIATNEIKKGAFDGDN